MELGRRSCTADILDQTESGGLKPPEEEKRTDLKIRHHNSWLRIGTALERWPIVVAAVGIVARGLLLGLLGLGAQGRLTGCVVRDLAREHDIAEAGLDGIKLGRGNKVFLFRRQDAGNLFLRILNAVRSRRMRRKHLGNSPRSTLLVRLNALK